MSGSPTLKLHNLTSATNRMHNSLINLPTNPNLEKIKKDIQKLRQRSHIMSLLYDKCIVAVAGLQGVGKSTLMSNLYEFDDENSPFLGNQGQGETLPILITESAKPGQLFVHKVVNTDGNSSFIREEIKDIKLFREKAHKYNQSEDLLLEVTVRFKVFNSSDRSFLLLPGFQKEASDLKELTYTALRTSMNCLVLFFPNKFANKDNRELIETLNAEFNEASPIFMITWSDKEEDNLELAERVKRDMNIGEEERVIRTGTPGPKGWREDLTNAVRKYSRPSSGSLAVHNKNVGKLIEDYNKVIAEIEVELRNQDVNIANKDYVQVERVLKAFRKMSIQIKDELKIELSKVYSGYFSRINDCVESELVKQYAGMGGRLKSLGEFFTNDIINRKELKDLINKCIKNSNTNDVQQELVIVLNRISNNLWGRYKILMNLPVDVNTKYDKKTLIAGEESNSELSVPREALDDIITIFNADSKTEFSDNLTFNLELLPLLALESYRVNSVVALGLPEGVFPIEAFHDSSLIKHYQENKKEVAVGVGVIFGMDMLEGDGIDLFGLIQHNAANGGTAMAAASFNWVLAGLAVGAAVIYMLDQMSKSIDKKASSAFYHIDKMKDYTIENVLANYDRGMERYEDILHGCLVRKYGLQKQFANVQNCYLSLKVLEDISREIAKLVKGEKWAS